LAATTSKKVVIRRFDREPLAGFVNPHNYLQAGGLELLSTSGVVAVVPYDEVKAVYFVRDFGADEPAPEKRTFSSRPKTEGLWVRMRFRDGEVMDGLFPNNLLQLESPGFTFVPPNPSSNSQRVFVPRSAVTEVHVLGVVGSPLRARRARGKAKTEQIGLFE
jgi:hypothetical protein